jgi:hypothetical protein
MTDQPPRRKFGPSKGELQFWLIVSLIGFAGMAAVIALRGFPSGPGWVEVVGLPGAFFGWMLWRSVTRLRRGDYPPG